MITELELKKAFDEAVRTFMFEEIGRKSIGREISDVKFFDKGSKLVITREGKEQVEIEAKEHTVAATIGHEYLRNSDFDMVRAFFETLATKMADRETQEIIDEMVAHAGTQINAKGDVLGGIIEAVKEMKKKGHDPDTIIANPETLRKLQIAMEANPEKAQLLRKLLAKEKSL
jgi:hypothetical protein